MDALYRTVKEKGQRSISRRTIENWLKSQDPYTLHKPVRWHYSRQKVVVAGIDSQWQVDLVDLSSLAKFNKNYKFLLTCIDVFSKYAWVVPLKNKSGMSTEEAFRTIFKSGQIFAKSNTV